jgi:hypothetical protein
MKAWQIILVNLALVLAVASSVVSQTSAPVPKYDFDTEGTFAGTISAVSERSCPVSGGMGFHFVLKLQDGQTIEVHVTTSKFMKAYEWALHEGDQVKVVGSKVSFEGVETIFAREITRKNETFVFRDKTGKPVW